MYRTLAVLVALLAVAPVSAQSAQSLPLEPGDRIRFSAPFPGDPMVGARVVSTGPIYLGFAVDGRPGIVYTREFSSIDMIDVRRRPPGRESMRAGALMGLYIGAAAGLIGGTFLAPSLSMETGSAALLLGGAGILVGSLAGAATGAALKPSRWYRFVVPN